MKSKKDSLSDRVRLLQKKLKLNLFDGCIIENQVDLLYYTGLQFSAGYLLIFLDSAHLFVDGRYIQIAQEKAPMPAVLEDSKTLEKHLKACKAKKIISDGQTTSYDRLMDWKKKVKPFGISIVSKSDFFRPLRSIKDSEEIDKMRKSAKLNYEGYLHIRSILKEGITEIQVAKEFEIFCLKKGAEKLAFDPIIAFGSNSAMPHYRSQDVPLRSGDLHLRTWSRS
ncbi:MAG: aminopeptidase P family protein [Chlamydiales bacterium]|nr:aminopeptidase P family protein [Chlamydiales bacterium]